MKADASALVKAAQDSPGVYEVIRLYAQYEKVLAQTRAYVTARAPIVVGFSSSDRTG